MALLASSTSVHIYKYIKRWLYHAYGLFSARPPCSRVADIRYKLRRLLLLVCPHSPGTPLDFPPHTDKGKSSDKLPLSWASRGKDSCVRSTLLGPLEKPGSVPRFLRFCSLCLSSARVRRSDLAWPQELLSLASIESPVARLPAWHGSARAPQTRR